MNIKRMGSQVIDGEKKFVKDKSDKGLVWKYTKNSYCLPLKKKGQPD